MKIERLFSFIHSFVVVVTLILAKLNVTTHIFAINLSTIYFFFDTLNYIWNFDYTFMTIGMLIHHAISLFMLLHYPPSNDILFEGMTSMYLAAEVSNVALTMTGLSKNYLSTEHFQRMLKFEFVVYFACRCIWMGIIISNHRHKLNNLVYATAYFYIMGLYWSFHLFQKLVFSKSNSPAKKLDT